MSIDLDRARPDIHPDQGRLSIFDWGADPGMHSGVLDHNNVHPVPVDQRAPHEVLSPEARDALKTSVQQRITDFRLSEHPDHQPATLWQGVRLLEGLESAKADIGLLQRNGVAVESDVITEIDAALAKDIDFWMPNSDKQEARIRRIAQGGKPALIPEKLWARVRDSAEGQRIQRNASRHLAYIEARRKLARDTVYRPEALPRGSRPAPAVAPDIQPAAANTQPTPVLSRGERARRVLENIALFPFERTPGLRGALNGWQASPERDARRAEDRERRHDLYNRIGFAATAVGFGLLERAGDLSDRMRSGTRNFYQNHLSNEARARNLARNGTDAARDARHARRAQRRGSAPAAARRAPQQSAAELAQIGAAETQRQAMEEARAKRAQAAASMRRRASRAPVRSRAVTAGARR